MKSFLLNLVLGFSACVACLGSLSAIAAIAVPQLPCNGAVCDSGCTALGIKLTGGNALPCVWIVPPPPSTAPVNPCLVILGRCECTGCIQSGNNPISASCTCMSQ